MRIRLFKVLTLWLFACAAITVATPGCEEPTEPTLVPPELETPAATTAPSTPPKTGTSGAPPPAVAPRTTAEYRKAAEAGDVPSMLLLARSHEALGQRGEAHKWYALAAEKGNEDARTALAALDAPPPVANATPATPTQPSRPSPSTAPGDIASIGSGTASALSGPATRRVATAPLPPGEPGKLRWIDIGAVLNYEDIKGQAGM